MYYKRKRCERCEECEVMSTVILGAFLLLIFFVLFAGFMGVGLR
jgi:hypothetical protein